MPLKHTKVSAKADGGDSTLILPSDWNAEHIIDQTGVLTTAANVALGGPSVPAAGKATLFTKSIGGKMLAASIGPSGLDSVYLPHMARNRASWWLPTPNAIVAPVLASGFGAFTTVGSLVAGTLTVTTMGTRARRIGSASAATAGGLSSWYQTVASFSMGASGTINYGGFHLVIRFICADAATVAGARQFTGVGTSVAAPTNVEPSTLINVIGVGHGTADTNLKIYYGGSAAQTAIDLGANFPANTLTTDVYELALFCASGVNNSVGYRVERLNTGHVAEGTLSAATPGTQLPLNSTLMAIRLWRCNNATALAVNMALVQVYLETDD